MALLGALTCEFGLLKYGLPSMKLVGSNLLSLMYVCAVLATYSIVDFSALLGIGDPIQASCSHRSFWLYQVLPLLVIRDLHLTYKISLDDAIDSDFRLGMDLVGLVSIATQGTTKLYFHSNDFHMLIWIL